MADVRSVLDHLLEGRAALIAEVDRLSAAIADLDAVIGRLGGTDRPGASTGAGGKSIRVHVLEMLESTQREMGLAEIIDRVHAAGIQAHDDAVRSITVKLMKDGKVERVGRGQYRLAGASTSAGATVSEATSSVEPALSATPVDGPAPVAAEPAVAPTGGQDLGATGYTPPLNLGQPWQQR